MMVVQPKQLLLYTIPTGTPIQVQNNTHQGPSRFVKGSIYFVSLHAIKNVEKRPHFCMWFYVIGNFWIVESCFECGLEKSSFFQTEHPSRSSSTHQGPLPLSNTSFSFTHWSCTPKMYTEGNLLLPRHSLISRSQSQPIPIPVSRPTNTKTVCRTSLAITSTDLQPLLPYLLQRQLRPVLLSKTPTSPTLSKTISRFWTRRTSMPPSLLLIVVCDEETVADCGASV